MLDNEAPRDEILDDEDELEEDELDSSEDEDSEQPGEQDELSALRAEIQALKEQSARPPWLNELKTIQGRMSSIEARLQKSEDPATRQALLRDLRNEASKSDDIVAELLSGLDETAFTDPSVKQKAAQTLAERRQAAEREALRQQILDELQPKQDPKPNQQQVGDYRKAEGVRVWEATWTEVISDSGLDPDSEDLAPVWKGVSAYVAVGDFQGANQYMKKGLESLRADVNQAAQRQKAKNSAGKGSPKGTGDSVGPLDPSRPSKERIAHLQSIGAI